MTDDEEFTIEDVLGSDPDVYFFAAQKGGEAFVDVGIPGSDFAPIADLLSRGVRLIADQTGAPEEAIATDIAARAIAKRDQARVTEVRDRDDG